MNGQIFISYRREDGSAWAGRLYDHLKSRFASEKLFMDVDSLAPGVDFVEALERSVGGCDVLIAVIGRRWLSASDEEGNRRLDQPEDFVRVEVATALKRGIRVIPVLVEGASMPRSRELPDDLKTLVRRNALEVSHNRFSADSERLIRAVEEVLESARVEQQRKREEEERVEAERRECKEKERLQAEQRAQAERLELERQQANLRAEQERLEAERRQREAQERLEAERKERARQQVEAEQREVGRRQQEEQERLRAEQLLGADKERLEAQRRETEVKEWGEAGRQQKEEQERLTTEQPQRAEQERLKVGRPQRQGREGLEDERRETEARRRLEGGSQVPGQNETVVLEGTDAGSGAPPPYWASPEEGTAKPKNPWWLLVVIGSGVTILLLSVGLFNRPARTSVPVSQTESNPAAYSAESAEWFAEAKRYLDANDYAKALPLLQKAAEADNPEALNQLGELYYYGRGVGLDYAQARRWFQKAAEAGNATAMTNLGYLYDHGWGVAQDHAQAVKWFQKATEAGSKHANRLPSNSAASSTTPSPAAWLAEAKRYLDAKRYAEALLPLQKAAAAGNAEAMNQLGELYYYSRGVDLDYAKAREWYVKAASVGDARAMDNLGVLYENAQGGDPIYNYDEARRWYQKAADVGNADAKQALTRLSRK